MRPSALHLLHRAEQIADRLFLTGVLGSITPRQFAVLVAVAENEGLSQVDVSKRTGIDWVTTIDVVRRLVRRGVLWRRRSQRDTRVYALRLTDKGRRLLANAEGVVGDIDAALTEALPPARRAPFLEALSTIAIKLEGT
jgi:MarR family transcriptional regulator, temperature-dependent positive regulator of motility